MKVTAITLQAKNKNRVNVMVDGTYRLSLDVAQVADLGVRVGKEYTKDELAALETESSYGKVYARALEYCLMRPHSSKEVSNYLYRKTRDTRTKTGSIKSGVSPLVAKRVFDRLVEKGYINDEKFARYWIETRHLIKGSSRRKLTAELRAKGVDNEIIERLLKESSRNDIEELQKIIAKKRARYADEQKFIHYLARQGFGYDDIKQALQALE